MLKISYSYGNQILFAGVLVFFSYSILLVSFYVFIYGSKTP